MIASADIRAQFPILSQTVNGKPLVYLDNAATTQKPARVISAMDDFYRTSNANIHRGVHTLSRKATALYEEARATIASHFGLNDPQQAIFTAGTTDSINFVAQGLAQGYVARGHEIIVPVSEHHSNLLPWQLLARQTGAKLLPLKLTGAHTIDLDALTGLITANTRLIALAHVSNTLGVISEISKVKELIAGRDIALFVDGAQSAPHMPVNVTQLGADFFACSAHKMYGPTGTGLLCLSPRWLRELPVSRPGGGTITTVSFESTTYAEGALRFEPGTPNIAGAIGFAEAVRFMDGIGMDAIHQHELRLTLKAQHGLQSMGGLKLYGTSDNKAGVVSFNMEGVHPYDVGTLLDQYGIAVRTGHHCTQPLMAALGETGTVRASFAVYNTEEEVSFFLDSMTKVIRRLS